MRSNKAAVAALAPLLFAAVAVAAETPQPGAGAVVERFHETLIGVMKESDTLGYDGRRDRLTPVLVETFDFDFMAEKSAGRHWKDLSEEQQARWRDAFRDHIVANYAGRFKGFTGQSFESRGEEEAPRETMLVKTTLHDPQGDDVQLNYRLHETDDGWRVIDIYMHGTVSELALRRAEYSTALERQGVDSVIDSLRKQADDLAVKNGD